MSRLWGGRGLTIGCRLDTLFSAQLRSGRVCLCAESILVSLFQPGFAPS